MAACPDPSTTPKSDQTATRARKAPLRTHAVLIADDHSMVRAGYRKFLESHPAVSSVGEATSGTDTLTKLRGARWDLLLLDISMPDRGGLDILERIMASYPSLKVLVVSSLPEEMYAPGVLKAGAYGYLSKALTGSELTTAISTVLEGRRYVSAAMTQILTGNLLGEQRESAHDALSARELQVLLKLASGRSVTEIANELRLSIKTISTYRTRVLRELNFQSNADLMRYALNQGLIQ